MFLHILIAIIVIFCGLKFTTFIHDYIRKRSVVKKNFRGPQDLFLIGNAHILEKDSVKFHQQLLHFSNMYIDEKSFYFWVGTQVFIVCHHPDSVEKVLSSNVIINKSDNYQFLHSWLGEGLLTSSGKKWHSRRKLLTPAFHFKILNDFLPVFNRNAQIMADIVASNLNKVTDAFPLYTMAALDAIAETAMGVSINAQLESDSDYVKAILILSEIIMNRTKNPFLYNEVIFGLTSMGRKYGKALEIVHEYSDRVIKQRKQQRKEISMTEKNPSEDESNINSKKRKFAFLDLLLEYQEQRKSNPSSEQITDRDIREEVDTFMFEGHDTTAAALTWATYLLAKYSAEQRKVQEELDDIFGDDREREITNDDLLRMNYLDQVMKEALRIYPSVPYIGRRVEKDFDLCGKTVPQGASIVILTFALHYREDIYPDPFTFKPERFSTTNRSSGDRSPFAYVPFSAGPRNCIGAKFANMEEKVLLATIFRKFNVTTEMKEEDLAPSSQLILRPSNPVNVKFSLR